MSKSYFLVLTWGEHEGTYPQASCSGHEGEHEVSTKPGNPHKNWGSGEH